MVSWWVLVHCGSSLQQSNQRFTQWVRSSVFYSIFSGFTKMRIFLVEKVHFTLKTKLEIQDKGKVHFSQVFFVKRAAK
jgi:hypothetical protein